ncbi:NAD(P)H-dependent flavin oxidoreductase [Odoribacter laneus]|jgi:thiazole biosynthesis protein thiG|uniref:NAD(P)H-dependent flavin oxidoreductase n=1 Tax=Odoribacter laneus TaxID=626933 RepID=UPI001896EB95|nr:nitronate monooxygenase [Odoribacter laneus]
MNRIKQLFHIKYPIIQGGMVWCSGWKLASAVSNNGGLGLLGAGSMHPEILVEHIRQMQKATSNPWGVNVPLLYPEIDRLIQILIEEKVKIVFTSAGSPKKWTSLLKTHGMTVVHVVSSALFAQKSEEAGVDAIVAEGFEAGGHNGREETTTLTLIPNVVAHCSLPVIAAGGIASGKAMAAMRMLGAEGVQIGSRFAIATESSAHPLFKEKVIQSAEGDTLLLLKKLAPTRLLKNEFFTQVKQLEDQGADASALSQLLGKGRAKKGIFEGDLAEGELEIGQIASMLYQQESVADIIRDIVTEYNQCMQNGKDFELEN